MWSFNNISNYSYSGSSRTIFNFRMYMKRMHEINYKYAIIFRVSISSPDQKPSLQRYLR